MHLEIGTQAPAFNLRDSQGDMVSTDDLKGRNSLIVFIPFPFTGTCEAELCTLRDNLAALNDLDANVVAITTDTAFANRVWSEQHGFGFRVLSDFWPHGEVTSAYGTFDSQVGAAFRTTYVLDTDGAIRGVVASKSRAVPREYDTYVEALQRIG